MPYFFDAYVGKVLREYYGYRLMIHSSHHLCCLFDLKADTISVPFRKMFRSLVLLLLVLDGSSAFLAPARSTASRRIRLNLSAQEDEIAALRAAAAKAREDAERMSRV